MDRPSTVRGALLGTALGDAAGLVTEGLSRRRLARLYPGSLGPNLVLRRGMMSDDGEHACMTAQALVVSAGDPQRFARSLGWRLRLWLLGLPAGIGLATGRAILKLWLGFPPSRSGVFSAGNGPAMRAPIIGAAWCDDRDTLMELVRISTRLTHTDPKAEWGAMAVALAAATAARKEAADTERFISELSKHLGDNAGEFLDLMKQVAVSVQCGESVSEFSDRLGLSQGVGGYMFHTVPVVLHLWMQNPVSYEKAVTEVIRLGGDTDTTAAILGGILGAGMGVEGLPDHWLTRLMDWPRSRRWMLSLADRLVQVRQTGRPMRPLFLFWPALPVRNAIFLTLVLGHGFRRLLPPW
ncbi:MAG: ADP-ribosylglycohydrolase family protein [Magnetococcales bacterium]|nr:ADP-ribosylglycohydrolase family protein [Magnetococcales bacterium]MBF0155567.1 ADP-ribosylglycohydrolase family protein [Magnetococcales bacterium]